MLLVLTLTIKPLMATSIWEMQMLMRVNFMIPLIVSKKFKDTVTFFNNKSRIFDDGYGQIWA